MSDQFRAPPANQDNEELVQRLKHMERLLQHYAGDINLDSENLRGLAEAVDKDQPPRAREQSVSQASDYLGGEEENFTVQPLGNNITRRSPSECCCIMYSLTADRLLGRVFTLELFYANKTMDRTMC